MESKKFFQYYKKYFWSVFWFVFWTGLKFIYYGFLTVLICHYIDVKSCDFLAGFIDDFLYDFS